MELVEDFERKQAMIFSARRKKGKGAITTTQAPKQPSLAEQKISEALKRRGRPRKAHVEKALTTR